MTINKYLVYYAFYHEDINDPDCTIENINIRIALLMANDYNQAEVLFKTDFDNIAYVVEVVKL